MNLRFLANEAWRVGGKGGGGVKTLFFSHNGLNSVEKNKYLTRFADVRKTSTFNWLLSSGKL